jgi:hypothetical protein
MKPGQLTVILILLMILPLFLNFTLPVKAATTKTIPSFYVGVDVAYESLAATEQLIDNISSYSNFFVIGCLGDRNETRLTTISQYVYDKNMSFIVYTDLPNYPSQKWFNYARTQWGTSFMGIYFYDEPGGKQLDQSDYPAVTSAKNYSDAASMYINSTNWWLRNSRWAITNNFAYPTEYQLFTSDYALYWYDYKAGYDTIFAEFGWNYSRQINVALCRGAAAVQNKDWGVMIAWTYTNPPYIESGPELYNDMVLAYNNGAKYVIVFDSNENYTESILGQEHLDAMKQFWEYTQNNPRTATPLSERTAYVLPDDYAYGFRGPLDKVWGLWEADWFSVNISMSVSSLMEVCGTKLDIIYPDPQQQTGSIGYGTVVNWNDSRLLPTNQWPDIPVTSAPSPTLAPTATPSPSPSLSLSPSPSSSQSPTPTEKPTPSPTPSAGAPMIMNYVYVIAAAVILVSVLSGLLFFRKKRLTDHS